MTYTVLELKRMRVAVIDGIIPLLKRHKAEVEQQILDLSQERERFQEHVRRLEAEEPGGLTSPRDPASQAGRVLTEEEFHEALRVAADEVEVVRIIEDHFDPPKRTLCLRFDVTGLPEHEVQALEFEASVQGEESDDYTESDVPPHDGEYYGHRSVRYLGSDVEEEER